MQRPNIKFWVTLLRAFRAVVLGSALLFQPEKARPFLFNFMGMFWLAGGIVSLRFSATGDRARSWSLIAGVIGILAGLAAITRRIMMGYIPELTVVYLISALMIMTGLMHFASGLTNRARGSRRTWASMLLGIFETLFGIMLFISPLSYGPVVYWAITLWAFVGGFILFTDAWWHRRQGAEKAPDATGTVSDTNP